MHKGNFWLLSSRICMHGHLAIPRVTAHVSSRAGRMILISCRSVPEEALASVHPQALNVALSFPLLELMYFIHGIHQYHCRKALEIPGFTFLLKMVLLTVELMRKQKSNERTKTDNSRHHSLLLQLHATRLGCEPDDICDFGLQACDTQPNTVADPMKEFIFSGKLNLIMIMTLYLVAALEAQRYMRIHFTHHEIRFDRALEKRKNVDKYAEKEKAKTRRKMHEFENPLEADEFQICQRCSM
ncbi:unnamed protein product, partial [Vitis vinifera]